MTPATILWPDEKKEWTRLLPRLRERFPHLLTLGEYDPEKRRGPAIWLKCMIARTLDGASWPEEDIPIVYLPGVSRRDIRAIERCPDESNPSQSSSTGASSGRRQTGATGPSGPF